MFEYKNSSCVVVGTFNIYIIQPQWLSEVEILKPDSKVKMQTDIRSPGFRFELGDDDNLQWNVRPDRMSIESENLIADCGRPISQVLEKLPWTPIIGVGCNVNYTLSLDQRDKISHLFVNGAIPNSYETQQKTWHRGVQRKDIVFNIQLAETDKQIELLLNVHIDTKKDGKIKDANQIAQRACTKFKEYTEESVRLAQSILGMEFNNDILNAS